MNRPPATKVPAAQVVARRLHLRKHHILMLIDINRGELVAARAVAPVGAHQLRAQDAPNERNCFITRLMSVRVIDAFQVIQVARHHAN